jgi:hypothetical protein
LSSGVKLKLAPEPLAYALPFFVTEHDFVKPAAVSAEEGSFTLLPRLICVPSGPLLGAPVIETDGATLAADQLKDSLAAVCSPSLADTSTAPEPLSSGV